MIFRVARHTNDIEKMVQFYTTILGLEVIGRFNNHEGYDGVMLGLQDLDWHLEFTCCPEEDFHVNPSSQEDDLIVFYPRFASQMKVIEENIDIHRLEIFTAKNPYWHRNGILIKDPDNYPIIISPLRIIP